MTKIGWTHWIQGDTKYIGHTLNLTGGCVHVHDGCKFCYAERMTHRLGSMPQTADRYGGLSKMTDAGVKFTGDVRLFPDVLDQIEKWKAPRCVFVNSMSDLFQDKVPADFIFAAWDKMRDLSAGREAAGSVPHIWLFLTKRPERTAALWAEYRIDGRRSGYAPWFGFGVSVSDQRTAAMIADLLQIKDGFRFVSFEPLIEAVDPTMIVCNHPAHNARGTLNALTGSWWPSIGDADAEERQRIDSDAKIDWVLAGCESGPRRRPMNPDWARSLRDQCRDAGVPFYLKQMEIGGKVTASPALDGVEQNEFPGGE